MSVIHGLTNPLKELVAKNTIKDALQFIEKHVPINNEQSAILSTTTVFNIENIKQKNNGTVYPSNIINLRKVNNIQRIDDFFFAVNQKLPEKGRFVGCFEPKNLRKQRILNKYPPVINWIYYFFDFIFKRVFPKVPYLRKIYHFVTLDRNRVLTKVETFGRLYFSGFKLVDQQEYDSQVFFVAEKVKSYCSDSEPSYGPLCQLTRNGKDGKPIKVFKIRTMHAYSEFLQEYIYETNKLQDGGKFKDDFRISNLGKFLRVFWIDEIPMVLNLLRGELKLVGVRPLSSQYLGLYHEELKQKRAKVKPGLIPPFYADMPQTLEEIMESEMKYLEAYEKNPLKTDMSYLSKAAKNILLKKAKSN